MIRKFFLTAVIVLSILVGFAFFVTPVKGQVGPKPNIIVIETDDQRWHTIDYMPTVKNRLIGEGITFTNSFVTTSLCCPSRSSFLTGLYAHNHGVLTNSYPDGGVEKFNDNSTLATWLKGAGYSTSLIGKYLNGYGNNRNPPFIPPGWTNWHVFLGTKYYDYDLYENGVTNHFGSTAADYSTDVLRDRAVRFIQNAKEPFFLWFTPFAPHAKPIAAPRHVGTCDSLAIPKTPATNEMDVSDKPLWVRKLPLQGIGALTSPARSQICTLKAVDEAVAAILSTLGTKLNNTVVIFTSDNGMSWMDHRWGSKPCIYEGCNRVPLVIRYPKLIPTATVNDKLVLNIDLAPTIAQLAGVAPASLVNGQSLVPLLSNPSADWRSDFLIEYQSDRVSPNSNFAVRTSRYKYVELGTGEKEFYDLVTDPYELNNSIKNSSYATIINQLKTRLNILKLE